MLVTVLTDKSKYHLLYLSIYLSLYLFSIQPSTKPRWKVQHAKFLWWVRCLFALYALCWHIFTHAAYFFFFLSVVWIKWSTFRNIILGYLYKAKVSVFQAELSQPSSFFQFSKNSGGLSCAVSPDYSSWTGPLFRLGWGYWIEAQNGVLCVKSLCLKIDYISVLPLPLRPKFINYSYKT